MLHSFRVQVCKQNRVFFGPDAAVVQLDGCQARQCKRVFFFSINGRLTNDANGVFAPGSPKNLRIVLEDAPAPGSRAPVCRQISAWWRLVRDISILRFRLAGFSLGSVILDSIHCRVQVQGGAHFGAVGAKRVTGCDDASLGGRCLVRSFTWDHPTGKQCGLSVTQIYRYFSAPPVAPLAPPDSSRPACRSSHASGASDSSTMASATSAKFCFTNGRPPNR